MTTTNRHEGTGDATGTTAMLDPPAVSTTQKREVAAIGELAEAMVNIKRLGIPKLRELQQRVDEQIEVETDRKRIDLLNRCWWAIRFQIEVKQNGNA